MEFMRKFGYWVAAGAIALAAFVVYLIGVPSLANQRQLKWNALAKSRDSLGRWAKAPGAIPNEAKVDEALRVGREVTLQLDDCGKYLSRQPRRCQSRSFFEDEHSDRQVEIPLDRPSAWREAYGKNNDELRKQLFDAGFSNSFPIQTMDSTWGTSAPTPEEITEAMQLFWFQKDLADLVTDQVEKDLAAYLGLKAKDRPDPFPAKPSDLVINRSPERLDEALRSKSRTQLVAILSAIAVNTQDWDLPTIFNTYLPDEGAGAPAAENGLPWDRKSGGQKISVLGLTMDEAQKNFLTEMLPPDKEDLADHGRFMDYVTELRSVRYRADVIRLLESQKDFQNLAGSLRKDTGEEDARVLAEFGREDLWTAARLAQAISAVVSIKDEKDYRVVHNNHAQNIAGLEGVNLIAGVGEEVETGAAGRPQGRRPMMGMRNPQGAGRGAAVSGATALYKVYSFGMNVRVQYKRIPILLRRFLTNSWRYRIRFANVIPSAVAAAATGGGGPSGRRGFQAMPTGTPAGGNAPTGAPGLAPSPTGEPEGEVLEAGHYVWIQVQGEGFQFSPLLQTTEKPAGAAAPGSAAPARPRATPMPARRGRTAR